MSRILIPLTIAAFVWALLENRLILAAVLTAFMLGIACVNPPK